MIQISIHAPHAGSDRIASGSPAGRLLFQPTLPMRGATYEASQKKCSKRFQPTLPMRGATKTVNDSEALVQFQPTLPMRGATDRCWLLAGHFEISTHAPHAGSDEEDDVPCCAGVFQPTLPMRGATRLLGLPLAHP